MDEIQTNLDTMIDLIISVPDQQLRQELVITLQRLQNAHTAFIRAMHEALTTEEVVISH